MPYEVGGAFRAADSEPRRARSRRKGSQQRGVRSQARWLNDFGCYQATRGMQARAFDSHCFLLRYSGTGKAKLGNHPPHA
eukprot:15465717-Alexandrium_andersonii.AAC.1